VAREKSEKQVTRDKPERPPKPPKPAKEKPVKEEKEQLSRQEQKERTREEILTTALALSQEHGFWQVSLRQLTKTVGIVPTAFYRHFATMDELGLELGARSFASLCRLVREVQRQVDPEQVHLIDEAVNILIQEVKEHREEFAFAARERVSGSQSVRRAVAYELDLFVSELAVVLAQLPDFREWSAEDISILSGLVVRNLVHRAEGLIEIPEGRQDLEDELRRTAVREMRMLLLGAMSWRSVGRQGTLES
jgi:AcrR family transcriptional regulator